MFSNGMTLSPFVTTDTKMSYHDSDPYYSPPPQHHPGPSSSDTVQGSPPSPRAEARRRPKYKRSKTGCMTCRVKKIKCDETKPVCQRCTHGSRECQWPECSPTRKKNVGRLDEKSSTNEIMVEPSSPTMPESPTLSTREGSPSRRSMVDLSLMPSLTSRPNDTFADIYSSSMSRDLMHCSSTSERTSLYPQHSPHMSFPPEIQYSTMRYDHMFVQDTQPARGIPASRPVYSRQGTYWGPEVEPYVVQYHELHSPYPVRPPGADQYPQDRYHGQ